MDRHDGVCGACGKEVGKFNVCGNCTAFWAYNNRGESRSAVRDMLSGYKRKSDRIVYFSLALMVVGGLFFEFATGTPEVLGLAAVIISVGVFIKYSYYAYNARRLLGELERTPSTWWRKPYPYFNCQSVD